MKALVCKQYGSPENLLIEEQDDPAPGDALPADDGGSRRPESALFKC